MYWNWIHAKSNKMHFKIFKVDDIFNTDDRRNFIYIKTKLQLFDCYLYTSLFFLTNVWTVGNYLFIYCFKTFIHTACMVFTKLGAKKIGVVVLMTINYYLF